MKKTLLSSLSMGIFIAFNTGQLSAQDEKPARVSITITENDMVTTDTTFELGKGHDPEMITKVVSQLTGEDIDINTTIKVVGAGDDEHGKHRNVMIIESDDSGEHHVINSSNHHMTIITEDGDEGHGRAKTIDVIVNTDEDVESLEDGEDLEVHVIKKGDKNVKIVKKIRVEIEDEDESANEAEK